MLTTRIELVTSSLPMRCATDCAMSAYLLKLIVSLLTINFKSQTNTQCLSSITIILPSHKMHRFTINIQSESVRQIFHICTSLHMKCAEPDKHAVFIVRIVPYLTPKSNFPYEGYGHSFCSATISILSE